MLTSKLNSLRQINQSAVTPTSSSSSSSLTPSPRSSNMTPFILSLSPLNRNNSDNNNNNNNIESLTNFKPFSKKDVYLKHEQARSFVIGRLYDKTGDIWYKHLYSKRFALKDMELEFEKYQPGHVANITEYQISQFKAYGYRIKDTFLIENYDYYGTERPSCSVFIDEVKVPLLDKMYKSSSASTADPLPLAQFIHDNCLNEHRYSIVTYFSALLSNKFNQDRIKELEEKIVKLEEKVYGEIDTLKQSKNHKNNYDNISINNNNNNNNNQQNPSIMMIE
jgi:hypothetical protein